jgi:phosphonate transport system permease protein
MISLIASFFPPYLSPSYLTALLVPLLQTVGMAAGGMLVACVIGLTVALLIGAEVRGARALYAMLSAVRAIPDLTLAILCVVVVGVGPAAGMLALAIFYTAMIGKVFADLFHAVDWRPIEALRTTGATRLMVAFYGLLPISIGNLVSAGCYSFECAVRAAVIVGAVGGGGLGAELVGTIVSFDYRRTTTLILLLVVLVSMLDSLSWLLRRHPRVILLFVPFGLAALWVYWPQTATLRHAAVTIGGMFPPALPISALEQLPRVRAPCSVRCWRYRWH